MSLTRWNHFSGKLVLPFIPYSEFIAADKEDDAQLSSQLSSMQCLRMQI
jgi:hypothetical protein